MTNIFLTIHERSADAAMMSVAMADLHVDGFELRLDALDDPGSFDLGAFRELSARPMILTRRSASGHDGVIDMEFIERGLDAGFDFVDVEFAPSIAREDLGRYRDRILLSYHDYDGTPDVAAIAAEMRSLGCSRTKIAVTPHSFRDNQRLLELLAIGGSGLPWYAGSNGSEAPITVIGMGSRGLYSRILAPYFGSEILFVAQDESGIAAPGQLTLASAAAIFGNPPRFARPRALFALVGNPAAHSLSPAIHNQKFYAADIPAAYSIIETDDFDDAVFPFAAGAKLAPTGLSVTAPFKENAFTYAERTGAKISPNARECGAANTLVRRVKNGRVEIAADNTDVDAFETALESCDANDTALVLGAGGTARAALLALRRRGIRTTLANRDEEKGRLVASQFGAPFVSLREIGTNEATTIVNTIPASASYRIPDNLIPACRSYIAAGYGTEDTNASRAQGNGARIFTGLDLLHAQAARQSQIFIDAARAEMARQEAEVAR